jgi:predicted metal-dependent peptidase
MPNVTRRETLMLGYDILPSFYENTMLSEIGKTLAVYIDFSASTFEYHAEVSKLIASLEEFKSARFFAFTENVYEIDYKDFLRGKFISGGTDIEPVYEHINKNGFEKALIITDGDFYPPEFVANARIFALLLGEFAETRNFGLIPEKTWKVK